jgi:hypothetical protein
MMAKDSNDQTPSGTGAEPDDLSHLFSSENGTEEVLGVTDETLALLNSAFGPDPVGVDSFFSLNFFSFG